MQPKPNSRALLLVLLAPLALSTAACSSSDDDHKSPAPAATTAPAAVKGTVTLRFGVADAARKSINLKDPLIGSVYGALWLAEDVAVTGPRDDAKQYASMAVENVDLRNAHVSTASWTSEPLEPNKYIFTGFMDLDGNDGKTQRPDVGDPATVPLPDKKFDIVEGQQIEFVENFDLIFN